MRQGWSEEFRREVLIPENRTKCPLRRQCIDQLWVAPLFHNPNRFILRYQFAAMLLEVASNARLDGGVTSVHGKEFGNDRRGTAASALA